MSKKDKGTMSQRITLLRKQLGMTQNDLADKAGVSKAQMSRYMTKDAQPSANVLSKMATALGVSTDFLLHGDADAKANASLAHAEVIQQYKEVDQLPGDERSTVIRVVAALLRDYKARQAYAS
jgi:transcriptional regulator with XRE-family HTH domain